MVLVWLEYKKNKNGAQEGYLCTYPLCKNTTEQHKHKH